MALTSVLPFQAGYFACSASHAAGAARARPARRSAPPPRPPPPIARLRARVLEQPADPVLSPVLPPVLPPVLSWKLRKFSNRFPSIMGTDSSVAAEQVRSSGLTAPEAKRSEA